MDRKTETAKLQTNCNFEKIHFLTIFKKKIVLYNIEIHNNNKKRKKVQVPDRINIKDTILCSGFYDYFYHYPDIQFGHNTDYADVTHS